MRTDRGAARNAAGGQQFLRSEQHAGRAIAALQCIALDECLLEVRYLVRTGHPPDGLDPHAVALHGEHQAAGHHHAIEAHAAGAAHAMFASDLAAGEGELLAQEIDESRARIDTLTYVLAVHVESNIVETLAHDRRSRTG